MPTYATRSRELVDPGRMRDRIGVYANVLTHDHGERTETPTVRAGLLAVPALVEYESAHERLRAGRAVSAVTIKISVRAGYAIGPEDLVLWDSGYWSVLSDPVPIDVRERFLRFVAVKTDALVTQSVLSVPLLRFTATATAAEVSGTSMYLVYAASDAAGYATHEYG